MNRLRVLSIVTESGHITPHSSSFASASAARISARVSVGGQHQFADPLLGVRQVLVAERLGHQQGEAQHELALGEVLRGALMRRMRRIVRGVGGAVQQADIAVHEHPLPRHVAHRRRTRCSPSPRSASRADDRNASVRDRNCRGTGSAAPACRTGWRRRPRTGCGPRCAARAAANRPRSRRRAARASPARARRARRCRRWFRARRCSAVPSCRLNMPEALRLRCRLISEWVRTMSFSRMYS